MITVWLSVILNTNWMGELILTPRGDVGHDCILMASWQPGGKINWNTFSFQVKLKSGRTGGGHGRTRGVQGSTGQRTSRSTPPDLSWSSQFFLMPHMFLLEITDQPLLCPGILLTNESIFYFGTKTLMNFVLCVVILLIVPCYMLHTVVILLVVKCCCYIAGSEMLLSYCC